MIVQLVLSALSLLMIVLLTRALRRSQCEVAALRSMETESCITHEQVVASLPESIQQDFTRRIYTPTSDAAGQAWGRIRREVERDLLNYADQCMERFRATAPSTAIPRDVTYTARLRFEHHYDMPTMPTTKETP